MRTALLFLAIVCLLLTVRLTAVEPAKLADAASPGIFGEFTLASGERVIGLYHPEQGTIEVYSPAKVRAVKARDIVATRRLAPEPEAEPVTLDAGRARINTLGSLYDDARGIVKRMENQRSELQKARQSQMLERSKRDEGNKSAEETLRMEKDPEQKTIFVALATEHLKGIAAANAAIADLDAELAALEVRFNAAVADSQDLKARMDWLLGRLAPLVREAEEKKARR